VGVLAEVALNALAEVLLHVPNSLPEEDREMIHLCFLAK
jgi:hypothetical protein